MPQPIYLDFQSTTPTDPRVIDAMIPYWKKRFGNPHSQTHRYGHEAKDAVELARNQVADLIGADPDEIYFTSGSTESNNIVVQGIVMRSGRKCIAHTTIEHKCVLEACSGQSRNGVEIIKIPVTSDGLVDFNFLADLPNNSISLSCVMYANNELGIVQPIEEISTILRKKGSLLHVDAAQAVGKIPINVINDGIDFMSISAHKLYGPSGIGALYIRREIRDEIRPLFYGGKQEKGIRPGTVPVPLCVGFGKACELAMQQMEKDSVHLEKCRAVFLSTLSDKIHNCKLNVDSTSRIPGTLNFRLPVPDVDLILTRLESKVAVSTGSACASGFIEPSHVLSAIGLTAEEAEQSLRLSFGRTSSLRDAKQAALYFSEALLTLDL